MVNALKINLRILDMWLIILRFVMIVADSKEETDIAAGCRQILPQFPFDILSVSSKGTP
jgi:hypothetical protein